MKIILGSQSKRRKEIFEKANINFDIVVSDCELDIKDKNYSDDLLLNCVFCKFNSILNKLKCKKNDIKLITADTIVILDNIIIGKPKDELDAYRILKSLSNKTHIVATGVMIGNENFSKKFIEKTYVTFRDLSDKEINDYIKNEKPFDKAGSYGIQDETFNFASKLDGDIDNVIGFPMNKCYKYIVE